MRHPSQRDFTVYEFNKDDEAIEPASGRFQSRLGKRGNPSVEESAISKYTFLRAFTEDMFGQNKEVAEDMTGKSQRNFPTGEHTCVALDDIPVSLNYNRCDLTSHDMVEAQSLVPECVKEDLPKMEVPIPVTPESGDEQSNCTLSDKQSDGMQVSVSSEDGDSCASSPPHADHEGSLQYPASADNWTDFREADDTDIPVIVVAEYVVCGCKLYAASRLIFSSDCIKIECSDESGKEFTCEWGITDIIHINCQWSPHVGTTLVKVWLKPSIGTGMDVDVHDASVVVRFCVPDCQWLAKEKKIVLLAPRYKHILSTVSDLKLPEEDDEILGPKPYIFRHYLTDFKESCEEVIYPKGDPDAVSISKRDLDLLQPETFVNDTIIDFYIKYLIRRIQPEKRHRFHFFNSFFFRKLVDLDKDPSSAAEGRAAFLRVRKWTRKVNIFEKDYIFIPVNFNLHWSLLVICHPGEVARFKEESAYKARRVPCILHMDSMKGSHAGLKDLVQSYLWEEWKERHDESLSLLSFSNLRFIPLELPQQQNSFDCGLFLLHYVELFLKEAPADFSPFTITKFSNFLTRDWFIPDEASHKRFVIHNLLCDLLNECEGDPPPCSDWHCSSEATESNSEKEAFEFLATPCNRVKAALDNSACSIAHDVTENKVSTLTSPDCARHEKQPELFLHHFFEPKSTRKASSDSGRHSLMQNHSFPNFRSTMSPIEEEEEPSGDFVFTPQDNLQSLTEILNTRMETTSCGLMDVGPPDTSQKLENSSQAEQHGDGDSSPNMASCVSPDSLETNPTKMNADTSLPHLTIDDVSHPRDETEKQRSSPGNCGEVPDSPLSVSREVLDNCVVEDSQDSDNTTSESADCGASVCCRETAGICHAIGIIDQGNLSDEKNVQSSDGNSVSMFTAQHPKRRKVMHEGRKCSQV